VNPEGVIFLNAGSWQANTWRFARSMDCVGPFEDFNGAEAFFHPGPREHYPLPWAPTGKYMAAGDKPAIVFSHHALGGWHYLPLSEVEAALAVVQTVACGANPWFAVFDYALDHSREEAVAPIKETQGFLAEHEGAAGAVVQVHGLHQVAVPEVVEVVEAHDVAPLGEVAPHVERAGVVRLHAHVVNLVVFDRVLVAVQPDREVGKVVNQVVGDAVAHAVNGDGGPVRPGYAVCVVEVIVDGVVAGRRECLAVTAAEQVPAVTLRGGVMKASFAGAPATSVASWIAAVTPIAATVIVTLPRLEPLKKKVTADCTGSAPAAMVQEGFV
jgi:hypothetical protein